MISFRTLGTSEKKKRAKTPATAPKDPAVIPLVELSAPGCFLYDIFWSAEAERVFPCLCWVLEIHCAEGNVQFHCPASAYAMVVGRDLIAAMEISDCFLHRLKASAGKERLALGHKVTCRSGSLAVW